MAHRCPKCGKEMARHGNFWICGDHAEPVFIPIEHPFSDLCAVLPTPIAFVLDEFFRESNPFIALWRMVDAAEIITRFFTITVLSDILRQKGEFPQPVKIALTEKLERPTFGAWKDLLAIAIDNLPKEKGQTRCFVFELPSFVRGKWLPALGSGEDKPEEKLIALRNFIAHAGRLPDEKAQELLSAHRQRFESLVNELSFLSNYDLIACTKEGQIVWLKGLPSADGSFPEFERSLSFSPALERVYLVHGDEWLDLFPLHAFTDILQWREELYDFERLEEVAPQIYFRLSERGYLECISFSTKAVFSHLGKDAYQRFREIFRLEEWRAQRKSEAEAQGIQKLWDELVNELTEVFVGREEHVRQVKEAVKRKSKGFLWISGKPGVGKSALMAKLMKDYIGQTQHYIVIPYFFRFGQAGLSVMDFLATALKRLQGELKRTIEPAPNLPDRQQQLVEALEEAVSKTGKKVLFLVDGLDEIYRQEREFLNVPFMAVREGVLWVCAGRSEGDLEEALKSRGAEWIFPDGLPPLDEQAVRAMLVEHLGRLKYALFERDEGQRNRFVEAVTRKSGGLPLYVRMVIEDLKAGQLTVWEEEKLPEGLVAYYERLLERLRVSDVGTVLTPLFCLLAWAKEPVTEGTMKFLLQTHHLARSPRWSELFRRALEHGHLMLQQRPTPDGEVGWTIYHDSFRQHLLESKTVSDNREWAQERWLEVCRDWKALASQEPSLHRYILRHYADHLHERWQMTYAQPQIPDAQSLYSALCQLALDTEFAQSQTHHLPNEPNLPLKTVQLALDASIKLEDAPMIARLVMEHAKRAQSEEETPLQAWRKGHRERALKMATEIIFERDHKLGTLWGLLLAWVAESEGEREWAKRCLDEVRKRWEGAKLTELEYWQDEMAAFLLGEMGQVEGAIEVAGLVLGDDGKKELATNWAVKGFFEQAMEIAKKIEYASRRSEVLGEIAVEMVKAGMVEQAMEIAEGIEDAKKRAETLSKIAEKMAKIGIEERAKKVFEQALKAAEEIEDTSEWIKALNAIAIRMVISEMFEQAMKVVERIEGVGNRALALRAIAEGMAIIRRKEQTKEIFNQALEVAEEIENTQKRAMILSIIAIGMSKAGIFEQALKATERIKDAEERGKALRKIAEEMAKAGMVEQAMKTAEGIEDAGWRAETLREIAVEMAKAGMFEQAKETAERIEDAGWQAWALSGIAEEMAKAGMVEKAKEVFEQAMETAERIEDAWRRAWALIEIAEGMARAGMFEKAKEALEKAVKTAERIEDAKERAEALRGIAIEMAKAGEVEGAVGIVERETGLRTEMLPSVLPMLAERAREGEKSKEGFLRLLPFCGWSLKLAYQACGLLAWLYPEQGEAIAKVVSGE
ncbi:MAG: AAA family ATPase [Candidatus Fervidibacter sacchari]